ncbi:MAG: hypothetical protein ACRDWE_10465 [Acidimicrobiales bacterium]
MWDSATEEYRRDQDDLVIAAWLTEEDHERLREHYRKATLEKLRAQVPRRVD